MQTFKKERTESETLEGGLVGSPKVYKRKQVPVIPRFRPRWETGKRPELPGSLIYNWGERRRGGTEDLQGKTTRGVVENYIKERCDQSQAGKEGSPSGT